MKILGYLLGKAIVETAEEIAGKALDTAEKIARNKEEIAVKNGIVYIKAPHNSGYYFDRNYLEVRDELIAFGFTNIVLLPQKDLIRGWLTKNGATAGVSINDKSSFTTKDKFRSDARIVITYHTFKENIRK